MDCEAILNERLALFEEIKQTFLSIFPSAPKRIRRGEIQEMILSNLEVSANGFNRRLVSEALLELGYARVKVMGHFYYSKKTD